MKEPWISDPECWKAFVIYQNKEVDVSQTVTEEMVRKLYLNPPSWSSIRTQYIIFEGGFELGKKVNSHG